MGNITREEILKVIDDIFNKPQPNPKREFKISMVKKPEPITKRIITIEELKETDWYKERPDIIKQAIEVLPPTELYKFKDSGKQCYIYSYNEPISGKLEDVTVTVQKTGVGGVLNLGLLDTNAVFGVKLNDLELWK